MHEFFTTFLFATHGLQFNDLKFFFVFCKLFDFLIKVLIIQIHYINFYFYLDTTFLMIFFLGASSAGAALAITGFSTGAGAEGATLATALEVEPPTLAFFAAGASSSSLSATSVLI
jgi:hypothetical protein